MEMKSSTRKLKYLLRTAVTILIVIQPFIDLDYLFYEYLDRFGLPRFSTVVRFLVLPALILACYILEEKNRKRIAISAMVYGCAFTAYFLLHTRQAAALFPRLALTENFRFSKWQELVYVLTLCLPYGMIYLFERIKFTKAEVRKICMFLSGMISIPIFVGDLFVFGKSTYYGYTVANFFSWFNGIYDFYHPRTLASKFFFNEGNTVGILLFMLLPVMFYFFLTEPDRKIKKILAVLIVIQQSSMQILATRVATYGSVLTAFLMLGLYVIDCVIRKEKIKRSAWLFCAATGLFFAATLNHTPAVENQRVDAINDTALLHNGLAQAGMDELANAEDLVPGTPEYINFYVYMFETYGINARYIQSVPSMYYTEYYNYQADPKFWVDVTFMPVFDRVSGRQIETIFFNYKYAKLTAQEKLLGMGYSTFMNGSIVLEQDFKQQVYTLGYIGAALLVLPWLVLTLYGAVSFLRKWKSLMTLENLSFAMAIAFGLGSGWLSGHMLDQFMTTSFAALVTAVLLNRIKEAE